MKYCMLKLLQLFTMASSYLSPSLSQAVMQTGYDHTVDWWAVGVLLFHFLAGVTPFMAESKVRVRVRVRLRAARHYACVATEIMERRIVSAVSSEIIILSF